MRKSQKRRFNRKPMARGCGCERAGIGVFNDTEIQRCDECNLFETDEDAAVAVDELLKLLHREYARYGGSVGDALDRLVELQRRDVLKTVEPVLAEGWENTGNVPESMFAEPYRLVRKALSTFEEQEQDNTPQS